MAERCTLYDCEPGSCGLLELLKNEAEAGGYVNPDMTVSAGVYWPTDTWMAFKNRMINLEGGHKCPFYDKVLAETERVTAEKKRKGELK